MRYDRNLIDKTRLTVEGKQYRVGNPKHPHYDMYKTYGLDTVLVAMGLAEVKHQEDKEVKEKFPWSNFVLATALVYLVIITTLGK